MGCHCTNNNKENYVDIEHLIQTPSNLNPNSCLCLSEYTRTMFKLINKVRKNPNDFAFLIESAVKYITTENDRLIFSYKLKVALHKGKEMFLAVADELRKMTPLTPLEFKDDIVIEVPTEEDEIKDVKVFQNKVLEKKKNVNINAYFKDAVGDPEVAILIMLVDDTQKNPGKKRETILNKDYKYIGISSVKERKTFCAYYTFST